MKRILGIIASCLLVGGIVMFFSLNGETQADKEAKRNREYEVSLVKALKNSYKDLEEIRISGSGYAEYPGDWSCTVRLTFLDGQSVEYGMGHSLYDDINRSAVTNGKDSDILSAHYGTTETEVKIIFSDGEETVE